MMNVEGYSEKTTERLKILFYPAWYPSEENPVNGIFVREHAKAVSIFNDVTVICIESYRKGQYQSVNTVSDQQEDGIRTIRLKQRKIWVRNIRQCIETWQSYLILRRLINHGWKPDIIHAHVYLSGIPALVLGRLFNIPVVITEHWSAFILQTLKQINMLEARFVMNHADIILPVSEELKQAIQSLGIQNTFEVVPNTVNTHMYHPSPFKDGRAGKKKMVMVALLKPVKGIVYLIQALGKLYQRRKDFTLDVIGDGPDRERYTTLVKNMGMEDIITFHGMKNKTDVGQFMAESDFYVQASISETFGVTLIEAMACGLPIVATEIPAFRDKVDKSRGILVPPKHVDAMVTALDDMLDHYQEYSSKNIRRYAQKHYSRESVGRRLTAIYNKVLAPISEE
jgi:L-malate glycosyltransferase